MKEKISNEEPKTLKSVTKINLESLLRQEETILEKVSQKRDKMGTSQKITRSNTYSTQQPGSSSQSSKQFE